MSQQMTPDDLWVARLRDRADEVTPDVLTDVGIVVRRGRRRRAARRASAIGGAAVLAIGIALGAAPAMRLLTDDVRPAVLPEDREVVVDTTNGTITLPLDRYFLTETEQAEVRHASALAMHECAADRGYAISDLASRSFLTPWTEPNPIGDRRFGVWWMPSAETFGYGTSGVPSNTYGVSDETGGRARTGEQRDILDECGQTPTVQQFWPDTELSEHTPDFVGLALESSAGRAALDDWDACLVTHGLYRREQGGRWDVTDGERRSNGTPAEYGDNLGPASAVVDARCKADVDLVDRLTQMVADRQAPFIAAHRSELTAIRVALDNSLDRARDYVDEHG